MVDAGISAAVKKLGEFVAEKLAVPREVQSNAVWLKKELEYMKSYLKDAEGSQSGNHIAKQWVSELNSITDDTVKVLERFQLAYHEEVPTCMDFAPSLIKSWIGICLRYVRLYACIFTEETNVYDIGNEMGSLRKRVEFDLHRIRKTYGMSNIAIVGGETSDSTSKVSRKSDSLADQLFVGSEDVKSTLPAEISKESEVLDIGNETESLKKKRSVSEFTELMETYDISNVVPVGGGEISCSISKTLRRTDSIAEQLFVGYEDDNSRLPEEIFIESDALDIGNEMESLKKNKSVPDFTELIETYGINNVSTVGGGETSDSTSKTLRRSNSFTDQLIVGNEDVKSTLPAELFKELGVLDIGNETESLKKSESEPTELIETDGIKNVSTVGGVETSDSTSKTLRTSDNFADQLLVGNEVVKSKLSAEVFKETNVVDSGNEMEPLEEKKTVSESSEKIETYRINNIVIEGGNTSASTSKALRRSDSFVDQLPAKLFKETDVSEFSGLIETYGINDTAIDGKETIVSKTLRRSDSIADQLFVGYEDDKSMLLAELLKEEPRRSMISICGTGGSGKTCLARNLYNSEEVASSFCLRAWTYVSQEYTIPEILRRVLKSLDKKGKDGERIENIKEEDVGSCVYKLLKDTKYVVVVDDVWDRNVWDRLKIFFPDDFNRSRVIVTTRNKDVASRMDVRIYVHHLQLLNPEESWELFYKTLCRGAEEASWCSAGMKILGKEMVAKCEGLPLALVVLGELLEQKRSLLEWQSVNENIWSHFIDESFDKISHLFSLSYNDLSNEFKQCFLYMGMYPEDMEINPSNLILYWIAEDFIQVGAEGCIYDIVQTYLKELSNRNLIQVRHSYLWKIYQCKIPHFLRSLVVKKAFEMEVFEIYNPNAKKPSLYSNQNRHVIHTELERYVTTDHSNSKLQSLIVLESDLMGQFATKKLVDTLGTYSHLCSLRLHLGETPQDVLVVLGSLTQLKILELIASSRRIDLPSSIGNLVRLQTLVVRNNVVCNLPLEISSLINLKNLQCTRLDGNVAEIGALPNLQMLRNVKYEHLAMISTHNLVNLQELSIHKIEEKNGTAYSLESIAMLKSLHHLVLKCSDSKTSFPPLDFLFSLQRLCRLDLEIGKIKKLPPTEKWPTSITKLVLEIEIEEDPIPTVERIPNLKFLLLKGLAYTSPTMCFSPQSFSQLEELWVSGLKQLKAVELGEGALPIIKRLCLWNYTQQLKENIPEKLKLVLFVYTNKCTF